MARKAKIPTLQPIIFDTDVLICYFRGNAEIKKILENEDPEGRWISSLTLMELLQGCRNQKEVREVEAFVAENISRIIHPRTSISEKAIHLVSEYALTRGLRAIDALIAATALLHKATLITSNFKHFSFIPGIQVRRFVQNGR